MSVALKWIEPEELGAYLKKGWTEVELRFEASGKYLIASPDEPASEPAKVGYVCPKCGASEEGHYDCRARSYTCKPAQPEPVAEVGNEDCVKAKQEGLWLAKVLEPVAAEMPEAVRDCISSLVQAAADSDEPDDQFEYQRVAENLESFWRTHAAQPAKVRMTEELQRVLEAAETQAAYHTSFTGENPALECREIRAAIAAVRAQAAEAGKVRMPKVRELLDHLYTEIGFSNKIDVLTQAAFAALDAVEGKGEGRG